MSFFGGSNPFATQVGKLIEDATDPTMASENWGKNIEICDIINETEDGPKDSIKAIKKRLQMLAGKHHNGVMYTLTVLETCVKNCGKRFHLQVASKDFLNELVKVIGPKNDPPQIVQEKVLSLIQTWADAFRGSPDLKEVVKTYEELKKKGIEFPMTDLDNLAPIHTPARGVGEIDPSSTPVPVQQVPAPASPGPRALNHDQMSKLKTELDVVQGNTRVFGEMLTELQSGNGNPEDEELLKELATTCRAMQKRLVELIERVANEEVTGELLRINDDLNNVFVRFERYERNRPQAGTEPPPLTLAAPPPSYPGTGEQPLIDLSTPSPAATAMVTQPPAYPGVTQQAAAGGQAEATPQQSDEFDMFAQSRQTFDANKASTQRTGEIPAGVLALSRNKSSYDAQQADAYPGGLGAAVNAKNTGNPYKQDANAADTVSDYDEMEKWLKLNPGMVQTEATSAEFDKFLASRAAEAEKLPDVPSSTQSTPSATGVTSSSGTEPPRIPPRTLQKDDQENALFAL